MADKKGFLVVLEGIDGAGKTAVVEHFTGEEIRDFNYDSVPHFTEELHKRFIAVTKTFEPTHSEIGKQIRKVLKNEIKVDKNSLHQMFIDDRELHLKELKSLLDANHLIIMDRYFYSNAAYQGHSKEECDEILKVNRDNFPEPDLLVYLTIDPETARQRIALRAKQNNLPREIFDDEKEQKRIKENYDYIIPKNALVINTDENTPHQVCVKIVDEILKR